MQDEKVACRDLGKHYSSTRLAVSERPNLNARLVSQYPNLSALSVYGVNYASNVKCLCVIQMKAVRLICNADRLAHTNKLYKELYILKFPEFVQYKTAILMFHLFHGTLPIHLQNRFTIYSTTRSTRRINTFVMVQARTNIKAMCLSVYGVKLWNSLPNNLRDCNSVIIFKKKLKKYFISIY